MRIILLPLYKLVFPAEFSWFSVWLQQRRDDPTRRRSGPELWSRYGRTTQAENTQRLYIVRATATA